MRLYTEIEYKMDFEDYKNISKTSKYTYKDIEHKVESFEWNVSNGLCKIKLYLEK